MKYAVRVARLRGLAGFEEILTGDIVRSYLKEGVKLEDLKIGKHYSILSPVVIDKAFSSYEISLKLAE